MTVIHPREAIGRTSPIFFSKKMRGNPKLCIGELGTDGANSGPSWMGAEFMRFLFRRVSSNISRAPATYPHCANIWKDSAAGWPTTLARIKRLIPKMLDGCS